MIVWKTLIYQQIKYNNYEINQQGDIKDVQNGNILNKHESSSHKGKKYLTSTININGKYKCIIIHRSVAETFIENPEHYKYVLFKDNDYNHISEDNLFWSKHKDAEYINRRKENNKKQVIKRRQKLKAMAVEYKGGKCCICGYNKCLAVLEFHHLDPTQKEFGISTSGTTKSWDKIQTELNKCICVCSNCHKEIHNGLIDLENYNIV